MDKETLEKMLKMNGLKELMIVGDKGLSKRIVKDVHCITTRTKYGTSYYCFIDLRLLNKKNMVYIYSHMMGGEPIHDSKDRDYVLKIHKEIVSLGINVEVD